MTEFTDEDNKEAMLKAFELFAPFIEAVPCNNCLFFHKHLPEDPCSIGCPNSWPLFNTDTKTGYKNRRLVLDVLRRKEYTTKEYTTKDPDICEYLNRIANGGDIYPSDIKL